MKGNTEMSVHVSVCADSSASHSVSSLLCFLQTRSFPLNKLVTFIHEAEQQQHTESIYRHVYTVVCMNV